MPGVEDFIVDLARTGKSCKEIKQTLDSVYLDKSMTRKQIYNILKHVKYGKNTDDQRHFNAKKTKQTLSLVATDVIDNQCCGSKYIEFGSGSRSRILAQFGAGSRKLLNMDLIRIRIHNTANTFFVS